MEKLPVKVRADLKEKLLFYSHDPLKYAIKLTDVKIGQYRFRIGNYRVVFDIAGNKIIILTIGNRKDIYK